MRRRNAFAKIVLERLDGYRRLSPEDQDFAMLLACGVASTSSILDDILNSYLDKPNDLQRDARDAMRLSTYEIIYLSKSPYAAVSQGVELVRSVAPHLAGFANAVLHKIAESAETFPWGDPAKDTAALARLHGYPVWLTDLLITQRGRERAVSMVTSTDRPAPLYVAANPFMCTDEDALSRLREIDPGTVPFGVSGCFKVEDAGAVLRSDLISSGTFIVADAAAQCVARIACPPEGSDFLEVASGRGTKTVLLQGWGQRLYGQTGKLFALDVHDYKATILTDRMQLCAVPDVTALCGDATRLGGVEGLPKGFDSIFIDAPCSGLGALRRHPEKRMRVTRDDIKSLSDLGLALLSSAAEHVNDGGALIYATCSVTRDENESVIARFLSTPLGRRFHVESVEALLPPDFSDCLTSEGYFQSFPSLDGPDGHFAVRLVRKTAGSR